MLLKSKRLSNKKVCRTPKPLSNSYSENPNFSSCTTTVVPTKLHDLMERLTQSHATISSQVFKSPPNGM